MTDTTHELTKKTSGIGSLDFGYSRFWTYGQLLPAVAFGGLATASGALDLPGGVGIASAALAIWAAAGFVVMRTVVRMNDLGPRPSSNFAPGASRILDLGCGAGRTSIMVALARPESRVGALDDFSADYIDGHGEANTLSNLRAAGVEDRVEIQSGDMRHIPFPDASFDGVVSNAAIDHLERGRHPPRARRGKTRAATRWTGLVVADRSEPVDIHRLWTAALLPHRLRNP